MDKLIDLKKLVLCFKDGQERIFELPYSVQVYKDDENALVLAQLIIDLMNKVKTLEDKIKKD